MCAVAVWLAILAAVVGGNARAAEYTIAPTPAWVRPVAVPEQPVIRQEQLVDGAFHLLIDAQLRATRGEPAQYRRYAVKALNASGVESIANIQIGFDPAYQTLVLHSIDVIRDGVATSRLRTAQVRLLQREAGLEERIYDGRKSASIFLEDVRVGDVVDYAYSVRGSNPVFGGRPFGVSMLRYTEPVGRIHQRLLFDRAHPPIVRTRNTDLVPTTRDVGDTREVEWSIDDVEPLVVESDAPAWYDPYPMVQWSAYPDWAAVVQWALPLYAQRQPPGAALRAEVDRIAAAHATPAARAMAALQFVQGEIRYLGVEIGVNSHAPNPPDLVLKRRFGDCKDKAVLLVAMLRALHVEATPALVNTSIDKAIEGRLPQPYAFDHVITRVRVDGKDYWLDPTRPRQDGAGLDQVHQPDFGRALLVAPGTTGLVPMDNPSQAAARTLVAVVIDARKGFDQPVEYTVTTTSRGGHAEYKRNLYRTNPSADMQKNALNFYARSYPHIELAAPMETHDDAAENAYTVVEHYTLGGLPHASADGRTMTAEFSFPDTESLLQDPDSTIRHAPLGRAHPFEATTTTEILLPMRTSVAERSSHVDDPAFLFERSITLPDDHRVLITDHYVARADHVAVDDIAGYVAHLREAREGLGYALKWSVAKASGAPPPINWTVWLFTLATIIAAFIGAVYLYRWDPAPMAIERRGGPVGLGGWLVLPILGLVAVPVADLAILRTLLHIDADAWSTLTDPASPSYHALWAPVILYECAAEVMRSAFCVLLLVLLLKRRTSLPRLMIALLWLQLLATLVDSALSAPVLAAKDAQGAGFEAARMLIAAMIWTAYFNNSQRVRATFVRRYRASAATEAMPLVPPADTPVDADSPAATPLAAATSTAP
jgi:transglutaminase-like putative cysteine protease